MKIPDELKTRNQLQIELKKDQKIFYFVIGFVTNALFCIILEIMF